MILRSKLKCFFCNLLIVSAPPLENQWCGVEIENVLFSSVILKTNLLASKLVTHKNHLPSSKKFIGGDNEKVSICLFNLNSSVSCGFDFVCSINLTVCFSDKNNNSLFI